MTKNTALKASQDNNNEVDGFESRPVRSNNALKPSEMTVFCVSNKTVQKTATRRTKFKNMIRPFTTPEIKRYANNDWCVEYWYRVPEDWPEYPALKRFKVRDGINYIKDQELKEKEAQQLYKDVKEALEKHGFNPFKFIIQAQKEINDFKEKKVKEIKLFSPAEAKEYFINQKIKLNSAARTIDGYESFLKNFLIWVDSRNENLANKFPYKDISDIGTEAIESYLEESSDQNNWSARTYNNNLKGLITFFNFLEKKKKITKNPLANNVIETRTSRAERNKYYNKGTRNLIQPELDSRPYLDLFVKWIYYSCARPNELLRLRVSNIDLDLRKILVPAAVGKTGAHVGSRTIPICEELYDIIVKMKIDTLPQNYFVFSKALKPGTTSLPDDYFREIYLPIKRKLGLDENYTLYSFKHTRVVDLLAAGYAAHLVMFLTGHTDWTSFQKYCRELGAVINEQLKGKTISY